MGRPAAVPREPFRDEASEVENIDETEALVAGSNKAPLELDTNVAGDDEGGRPSGGGCRPSSQGIVALLVSVVVCSAILARKSLGTSPASSPLPSRGVGPACSGDGPASASVRALQAENYREGRALLLNLHITHHAGTQFCSAMRQIGPVPSFACGKGDNWPANVSMTHPWGHNDTGPMAKEIRSHFHMIQWEYSFRPHPPLERVDWESPHLVSVIIMKHPMKRLLSAGGRIHATYGVAENRTEEQWLAYSDSKYTNNFALNVLMPKGCPAAGGSTTAECLESAKDLVRRFTFVLDVECLEEGIKAMSEELGFNRTPTVKNALKHNHPPVRGRIRNDTIYFKLLDRNRRDIELYEWSKSLSLVKCNMTR